MALRVPSSVRGTFLISRVASASPAVSRDTLGRPLSLASLPWPSSPFLRLSRGRHSAGLPNRPLWRRKSRCVVQSGGLSSSLHGSSHSLSEDTSETSSRPGIWAPQQGVGTRCSITRKTVREGQTLSDVCPSSADLRGSSTFFSQTGFFSFSTAAAAASLFSLPPSSATSATRPPQSSSSASLLPTCSLLSLAPSGTSCRKLAWFSMSEGRSFSTRSISGRLFYKRRPLQVPKLKPPNVRR